MSYRTQFQIQNTFAPKQTLAVQSSDVNDVSVLWQQQTTLQYLSQQLRQLDGRPHYDRGSSGDQPGSAKGFLMLSAQC